MKFPLSERPPPVALSRSQCREFDALARRLVSTTMAEYDEFVHENYRIMHSAEWRQVKSRDDVVVYKQVVRDPESPWSMPKLVAVGTIVGTLDDVMYGIVTPDAPSIMVKTSYVNDELLDGAVLHQIEGATVEDPFRYLGLKWMAMGHSRVVNALVKPRDFVFIESTGVQTLHGGDRVGFHAIHSIDHPQYPELTSLSIIRARLSNCYLYRETKPGVVEVYMTTYSDPGGNPPERIAVNSAANTLIGMWKATWCSQNKKLSWLLENVKIREQFGVASVKASKTQVAVTNKRCCNICANPRSSRWSPNADCALCTAYVCSDCRVQWKLSSANQKLVVTQRRVLVCKRCIPLIARADAAKIARTQYVPKYVPVETDWEDFDSARAVRIVFNDDCDRHSDFDTIRAMEIVVNDDARSSTSAEASSRDSYSDSATRQSHNDVVKRTSHRHARMSVDRATAPAHDDLDEPEFLYEQMQSLRMEGSSYDEPSVRGERVEL